MVECLSKCAGHPLPAGASERAACEQQCHVDHYHYQHVPDSPWTDVSPYTPMQLKAAYTASGSRTTNHNIFERGTRLQLFSNVIVEQMVQSLIYKPSIAWLIDAFNE